MPVYCSDFTKTFTIWFYFQFPENIDEKQLLSMDSEYKMRKERAK